MNTTLSASELGAFGAPETARQVAAALRLHADEVERARTLTPQVLNLLHEQGLFRLLRPKSLGGAGASLQVVLNVLEEVAAADASIAWALMIGAETPQLLAQLPHAEFTRLLAAHPDGLLAGGFAPRGTAERVEGGYRVHGRWGFATGSPHARWLLGNCAVLKDGQPARLPDGTPETRAVLVDREDAVLHDTWHALGLRGTGSGDFEVHGVFVPEHRTLNIFTSEPAARDPQFVAPVLQFALHMAAVAVGIAHGALQDVTALALKDKRRLYAGHALAQSDAFAQRLGWAETHTRAARATLAHEAAQLWGRICDAPEHAASHLPHVAATVHWVTRACVEVVDACFEAAGSSALFDHSPLQRRFRDVHTLAQHAGTSAVWAQRLGELRLGQGYRFTY